MSLVLVIKMEIHDKFNIILLPIFLPFKVRIKYPNKNVNFAYKFSNSQKLKKITSTFLTICQKL